jgi:hypothetical protein
MSVRTGIDLEMKVKLTLSPLYLLAEASRTRPRLIGKKSKMRKTNAVTAFPSSCAEDEDNLRVYNLAFEGTKQGLKNTQ